MTKKLKVYLLIILTAVCAACAFAGFAGCKIGRPGREEVLKDYKAHVTYYSNGGFFNESTTITVRDLYFKNDPGSESYDVNGVPFFEITDETTGMKVEREGYDLVGWYMPATYKDGENAGKIMYTYTYTDAAGQEHTDAVFPVLDENGNTVTDIEADRPVFARAGVNEQITEDKIRVIPSDVKLDSTRRVADDENLIVCAKWAPALKIVYKLVCEEGKTYTDEAGNEYKNGSELRQDNFGKGETSSPTSLEPIKLNGASFVRSYLDAELTTVVESIARPAGDEPENPVVYAHYIDGENWTIVTNDPGKVVEMFNGLGSASNKYYLLSDVDCASRTFSLKNQNVPVNATVQGNGKTISNLKFAVTGAARNDFSVFGNIGASFKLSNLKIENITIDITARGDIGLYAICNGLNASASIEGLEISGITAHIKIPADNKVTNVQFVMQDGSEFEDRSQWLFGGSDKDEQFQVKNPQIKVTGETTLTIEN
ncbi:MAG: hypothetical protein K2G26_04605 [Clostridia bacterium]|nr:hypothetical protein [Clostridia bacterium]